MESQPHLQIESWGKRSQLPWCRKDLLTGLFFPFCMDGKIIQERVVKSSVVLWISVFIKHIHNVPNSTGLKIFHLGYATWVVNRRGENTDSTVEMGRQKPCRHFQKRVYTLHAHACPDHQVQAWLLKALHFMNKEMGNQHIPSYCNHPQLFVSIFKATHLKKRSVCFKCCVLKRGNLHSKTEHRLTQFTQVVTESGWGSLLVVFLQTIHLLG